MVAGPDFGANDRSSVLMIPKDLKRFHILGTPVRATTYEELTEFCQSKVKSSSVFSVDFTNTQIVTMRKLDGQFREATSKVDYFIPDGMPLIWCLNLQKAGLSDRVYGPTFMRHCVTHSPEPFTHYFLGGSEECLEKLEASFRKWQPKVRIIGKHHGYFKEGDSGRIVDEINELSPDFVWVGLGTPKQQAWVHQHKDAIKRGAVMAVGFAFDVNAGTKPDAPLWMQRNGLGWLYRLCSEPRRLLGRYVYYNSMFLYLLLIGMINGKAWSASEGN
jgi:N-acetylglucosaminyldiphosphoundecaprenol N-acetyl-beta-D-mannosaminyltransferase